MTEHVHDWAGDDQGAVCCGCDETLTNAEANRRLNATERLRKLIADLQDANDGPNEMGGPFVALSVITTALEGE